MSWSRCPPIKVVIERKNFGDRTSDSGWPIRHRQTFPYTHAHSFSDDFVLSYTENA
jgi:hypothetical protein